MQVPNGVGSALGTIQLILYFIYRDSKSDGKKATAASSSGTQEEGTVEMAKHANSNGTTTQEEQV